MTGTSVVPHKYIHVLFFFYFLRWSLVSPLMTTLRLDSSCFTAFSAAYHRWLLPFVWVSARVHVYVCVYVYVCVCACVFLWSCKLEAKSEQYCGLHWTRSIRQKILITCYLLHNFEKQKKGGGSKKAEKGEERRKRKKKKRRLEAVDFGRYSRVRLLPVSNYSAFVCAVCVSSSAADRASFFFF